MEHSEFAARLVRLAGIVATFTLGAAFAAAAWKMFAVHDWTTFVLALFAGLFFLIAGADRLRWWWRDC